MEKEGSHGTGLDRVGTLGTLRLHHEESRQVILIPTPTDHPDDPLTWSTAYKYYIALLVCVATFAGCFVIGSPVVQILALAVEFGGGKNRAMLQHAITKVSFFFSTCALFQGLGNFLWIPLGNKYGRRPVYIFSFVLALASCIWAVLTKSYGSELAARIMLGFSLGASECLAPLTITEIFFLHERGKVIAFFAFSLLSGFSGGIVLGGLITISLSWEWIYWIAIIALGIILVLVIFTFPETSFRRNAAQPPSNTTPTVTAEDPESAENTSNSPHGNLDPGLNNKKKRFIHSLRVFTGTYTNESLVRMMVRPIMALVLPSVLWATVAMGLNLGFFVLVSINYAQAYSIAYGFKPWQSALCWIAGVIGGLLGMFVGGKSSDVIADYFTRKNNGIREAEMRLPTLVVPGVLGPLSLILYGASFEYNWHWMGPTVAIGLLNLSLVVSSTITMVFIFDSYRPIAGETIVTKMAFKAVVSFILSFYSNPWINNMGYLKAFVVMAAVYLGVFSLGIPMYFYGKHVRTKSITWKVMRYLHWHQDRETGE